MLNEAAKVDPSDLLVASYERLTEALLQWLRGAPPTSTETYEKALTKSVDWTDIEALETEIAEVELRGDILGMAVSLRNQAVGLAVEDRLNEAIRKAEQAGGIFLSRGSRSDYAHSLNVLGWLLNESKRHEEASQTLTKALTIAR